MTLTPQQLLVAYANGIFPMAQSADDPELGWYDPPWRGIIPMGRFHASRSLLRSLKSGDWAAQLNHDFPAVVDACADRDETWINAGLRGLYLELHALGHAHALSVTHQGQFAGGIFGISLGSAFFGESMVSRRSNGSKMALMWLFGQLSRSGFTLFDTQFLTPHLASLGGIEIPRSEYRRRLRVAVSRPADLTALPLPGASQVWQEMTQIS